MGVSPSARRCASRFWSTRNQAEWVRTSRPICVVRSLRWRCSIASRRTDVLMITVDNASPDQSFEQVRAQLAAQITDHALAVGLRLPCGVPKGCTLGRWA